MPKAVCLKRLYSSQHRWIEIFMSLGG